MGRGPTVGHLGRALRYAVQGALAAGLFVAAVYAPTWPWAVVFGVGTVLVLLAWRV